MARRARPDSPRRPPGFEPGLPTGAHWNVVRVHGCVCGRDGVSWRSRRCFLFTSNACLRASMRESALLGACVQCVGVCLCARARVLSSILIMSLSCIDSSFQKLMYIVYAGLCLGIDASIGAEFYFSRLTRVASVTVFIGS